MRGGKASILETEPRVRARQLFAFLRRTRVSTKTEAVFVCKYKRARDLQDIDNLPGNNQTLEHKETHCAELQKFQV